MAAYFSSLREAASSAAEPASQEAPVTYDLCTFASQLVHSYAKYRVHKLETEGAA